MAIDSNTVRLLILEESQNEAERIVSLFRNAGHATRVHRISSKEELDEALNHSWDLFIAAQNCQLSAQEALIMVQKAARDMSFILMVKNSESATITQALAMGVQGAVPLGEDERLILIAKRELGNLKTRRALREAEISLREVEKRCQLLLESSRDAISYVHDGMHIYANRTYLEMFGYQSADELEGMPIIDLVDSANQAEFKKFLKQYAKHSGEASFAFNSVNAEGESFKASMDFSPAQYDGEPCVQVVIRTVNDSAELEEKLREISSMDPVTNLFNRQHFLELLDQAAETTVKSGDPCSVAYIKLANYDKLRADIGLTGIDSLLAELAELARTTLSKQAMLARFADDAFSVIYPQSTPEQSKAELEKLIKATETRLFDIKGRTAQTTLSVGVALLSEKDNNASKVLKRAHRCADEVNNGNGLKIHNPADDLAAAASRGDIAAMLKQALNNNSLQLLYQPVINLQGGGLGQYEVLLRLIDPKGEPLSPNSFMEAAKEAGLAARIDRWVLLNAVRALAEQHKKGNNQLRVFVHLSSASIQDKTLLQWLAMVLKAARLPDNSLIIQLRETDAIAFLMQAQELSQQLSQLGCETALVQYGCAANPANTLKHLSVDYVKIDGSFTADMEGMEPPVALSNMLEQLHGQNIRTIIPMVESAATLAALWQTGANYVQGNYFQQPAAQMVYDFSAGDE